MATKKVTSTINVKPLGATAYNVKPIATVTNQYGASLTSANSRRFGTFLFGAKKFGTSVVNSLGQKMPKISTREV